MLKSDLLKEIENSKVKIKDYISNKKIGKDKVSDLIFKIIEYEPIEIQQTINLYYIDELSIKEISEFLDIEKIRVLQYFQLILFKIKLVLYIDSEEKNPYSIKNFGKSNNDKKEILFDEKS